MGKYQHAGRVAEFAGLRAILFVALPGTSLIMRGKSRIGLSESDPRQHAANTSFPESAVDRIWRYDSSLGHSCHVRLSLLKPLKSLLKYSREASHGQFPGEDILS